MRVLLASPSPILRTARAALQETGHSVVGPDDTAGALQAEACVLVPGWEESAPALIRAALAEGLGIPLVPFSEFIQEGTSAA